MRGGDACFEFRDRGQGKARFNAARDRHHLGAERLSKPEVVGIVGLGNNYFVTRIQHATHRELQGFVTSGGHNHVAGLDVKANALVVVGQTLAVGRKAG